MAIYSNTELYPQRIKLGWHRDLPEFTPSTPSLPASSLRSLKAACLANMGLAGLQAKEARRLFHPAEVEVTLEAVQRAPRRSEVERWLAARDGELGGEKAEG